MKKFRILSTIMFVFATVLFIGTLGASDTDQIGIKELVVRMVLVSVLFGVAWLVNKKAIDRSEE